MAPYRAGTVDRPANTRFSDIRHFSVVGSTNAVAAALAHEGSPEGVVVVADHQTDGRGRLGRRWQAAPGSSLLVSVILHPTLPPDRLHLTTIAMALAASDACEEVAAVRPLVKWPNDLVVDGGKLGGILAEAEPPAVVVGLGLNVNWGDQAPPAPGVSLDALVGHPVDREALLDALLRGLDRRLADPGSLLEDYRARSATVGQHVKVELGAGAVEGKAVGFTPEGHLVVDGKGGRRILAAGDVVHLRPV